MNFNWPRRDPIQWFEWLREHGSALAGKSPRDCVRYATTRLTGSHIGNTAKTTALARELCFAMEWAECGFPQIICSDKLFASFAATNIPQDAIPDSGIPWHCFVVRVPDSMWPMLNWGLGIDMPAVYMTVRRMSGEDAVFSWELHTADLPGASMQVAFKSISDLIDSSIDDSDAGQSVDWGSNGALVDVADDQRGMGRASLALRRAFVGCVLELSNSISAENLRSGNRGKRDSRGIPKAWTFQLTRAVKVDCRERVREIISGRSNKKLSVQVLVRGHWKNQPCGVGRSERKFMHIEPYWRGPEDAPIAVRAHILNGVV